MKLVIVKDNIEEAQKFEKQILESFDSSENEFSIDIFSTFDRFASKYNDDEIQLVFIDYDSVTDHDKLIADIEKMQTDAMNINIVLMSENIEVAIKGYEIEAFGFLHIPVRKEDLESIFKRFLTRLHIRRKKTLLIKQGKNSARIPYSDILFIESNDKVLFIHTAKFDTHKIYAKLSDVEKELVDNKKNFLRCHQSYIVNLEHVEKAEGNDFILVNKLRVPIRKRESKKMRSLYESYVASINS